jgi:vitamin B12/bleomycin/antimicrobial peptide transport system ATP-binding/permease protein
MKLKLNLNLLKQAAALAKPYWSSKEGRKSYWLVVLLILLLLADTQLNVWFNRQSGEFTSALAAREAGRFWHSIRVYLLLLLIAVPEYSAYYYARDRMAVNWRKALTHKVMDRYFRNHAFYQLRSEAEIDNPDQRIADDIYSITNQSINFLLIFAAAVFQVVAFGHVLWRISGHLVLFLVVYATIATLATYGVFGGKMISLHYLQRRKEADFRFGLVRVRENAEFIALYHGEGQELKRVQGLFGALYENYLRLIRWQFGLNFFQYTHTLLVALLPSVVIAPRVLSGELEVGRIVEATGAFSAIMGSLTILVDNMEDLAGFAAGISRVRTLNSRLHRGVSRVRSGLEKIEMVEGERLHFDNVTLHTPNYERTLIRNLKASIPCGKSLMIVGGSGLGKSSLLRMMAGLWNCGAGTVERPAASDLLFVPQHAYMIVGTLREQMSYPNLGRELADEELRDVLARVNLADLETRCGGFDRELDLEKVLSVGERQRLAFGRVLLKNPRYVLLDEATSALDRENEEALYEELAATSTTIVSVTHHASLAKFHSQVLELKPDGEWSLYAASKFKVTESLV